MAISSRSIRFGTISVVFDSKDTTVHQAQVTLPTKITTATTVNMLDTTFHITTPRLHLSYLDPDNDDHMSFVVRMFASAEMQALFTQSGMSPPVLKSITEARTIFAHGTDRLATTGIGRYIISLRNPPVPFTEEKEREYVGTLSMQLNRYPTLSCPKIPDIGFMLLPEYFGKGYATEGCEALMQHFREAKNHSRFAGFTHPENVNSQKLFMRLGFEKRGIVDVAGIVGDGSASRSAVWVKGVSRETELSELGIGSSNNDK